MFIQLSGHIHLPWIGLIFDFFVHNPINRALHSQSNNKLKLLIVELFIKKIKNKKTLK